MFENLHLCEPLRKFLTSKILDHTSYSENRRNLYKNRSNKVPSPSNYLYSKGFYVMVRAVLLPERALIGKTKNYNKTKIIMKSIHSSLCSESKMTYWWCGIYKGSRRTKTIYYLLGSIDMTENKSGIIRSLFLRVLMRLSTIYG